MVSRSTQKQANKSLVSKALRSTMRPRKQAALVRTTRRRRTPGNTNAVFGPVATVTSAPTAIGNSMQGTTPVVQHTRDGVRIMGRDFMMQLAAVDRPLTNWVLVGGCPLIPHAFVASVLRAYSSMYAEFVCHGFSFHYITGVPTSTVGNMMFYINKDRGAAGLDTSNPNFMSVVLSDPCTTVSPLWTNSTATYRPAPRIYSTSILNDEDLAHACPGELFVYTKTSLNSTVGSPGYVVVDFDITFKTLQTNPRDNLFPINRLKYAQVGLGYGVNVAITAGVEAIMQSTQTLLDGSTSNVTNDPNWRIGDVYKIIMCPQYGAFSVITAATLLSYPVRIGTETVGVNGQAIVIDDGFTCFGVTASGTNGLMMLYPTLPAAMTQQTPFVWQVSNASVQWDLPSWISLVGNVGGALYQSAF